MERKNSERFNWYLYFVCQLVSSLGSIMYGSAIPLLILDKTKSGTMMGMVVGGFSVIYIGTSFVAGILADKYDRRKILVISDLVNGGVIILYLLLIPNFSIKSFAFLIIIQAIATSFFDSANMAMFSQIAPKNEIEKANSLFTTGRNIIGIIAPIMGIFVYTKFGLKTLFLINMFSFIISGILEIFLKVRQEKKVENDKIKENRGYKEILEFFRREKEIRDLTILSIILNPLVSPLLGIGLIFFIKESVKLPSEYIGYIQSLIPIGMLIGSTFVYKYGKNLNLRKQYLNFILIQSTLLLCYYLFLSEIYYFNKILGIIYFGGVIIFVFVMNSLIRIPNTSLLHQVVDDDLKGRYFTLTSSIKMSIVPVMVAIIGFLMDKIDIKIIASVLIGLSFIAQFYFVKLKKLKSRYYKYIEIYNEDNLK